MRLQEGTVTESESQADFPKPMQPREHKAKVLVWCDLTIDDVDRLNECFTADHIKQVLADIFHLDSWKEDFREAIVMDLYYYTLQFARDSNFSREKTSAFFSIIKNIHSVCTETPFGNLESTFRYFKDLVLCHAVNRPPHSIELYSPEEVRRISEYTINTYFRHFKMYKYAFTPLVRLDLTINYQGIFVSPPSPEVPAEESAIETAEVAPEDQAAADIHRPKEGEEILGDDINDQVDEILGDDFNDQVDNADESEARKELRSMIQKYLAGEIEKVKVTVEQQLKATQDSLNKKLGVVDSPKKSPESGKKKK